MVMSYGMNPRNFALVFLGSMLITAPLFAKRVGQQSAPDQTKNDQAKPDQAAQSSSQPGAAPAATSPSPNNAPAQIVVPAGTHLPLVLHNGITTRNAQPGEPLYRETTCPVAVNDRSVIPTGSVGQGEISELNRQADVHGA